MPAEIVRVNDRRRLIEVAAEAETIKHAPHFGNEETVSAELEDRVRILLGLEPLLPPSDPYPPERHGPLRPGRPGGHRTGREDGGPAPAGRAAGDPLAGGRIPEDRWDRETTADGVTIHRRRRQSAGRIPAPPNG